MKLAVNERACTLYNEQTGQTLTESALHSVVGKANAYPKLVEALQGIALRGDDGHYCFDQCAKHELKEHSPFCQRYRAILRNLGEKW